MTSLEVIDTDAFLDMPVSCQNLYFHLNARADDDGFVASPKKVVRALSASSDDLKVLIAKKFLIEFADGVCVIKHWRVNNFIRKDIYRETQYLNLKQTLFIRPNGAYTTSDDERAIPVPKGHFKLEAIESTLTSRQLSIGKDRIVKSGENEDVLRGDNSITPFEEERVPKSKPKYPHSKEVFSWFPREFVEPSWKLNSTILQHSELLYKRGEEAVRGIIKFCRDNESDAFFPVWQDPTSLERNWTKIISFANRNGL